MSRLAVSAHLLVVLLALWSAASAQSDVHTVIQKSVEANKTDWKALSDYDYCVRVKQDQHTKTYDVQMILGSPYHRLVEVDGQPLSPSQERQETKKLQQETADRRSETQQQRQKRIANWKRSQERNQFLLEQLTDAFDFKMTGKPKLNGYPVYELAATPRPGYQPPNNKAKVLTGMKGTLWIDQNDFQWVKVQAKVVNPVSIAGFMARVEPGTRFELQQSPVGPGVWLPTYFSVTARAKVFFLIPHNSNEQDFFFNYRKAGTQQTRPCLDTSTTTQPEKGENDGNKM